MLDWLELGLHLSWRLRVVRIHVLRLGAVLGHAHATVCSSSWLAAPLHGVWVWLARRLLPVWVHSELHTVVGHHAPLGLLLRVLAWHSPILAHGVTALGRRPTVHRILLRHSLSLLLPMMTVSTRLLLMHRVWVVAAMALSFTWT